MEIICGIYKIENLINNKCYIGQSVNIKRRWKAHKEASKNIKNKTYDFPLYKAIRKYGLENFSFEILEICSENLLNEKEKYYVKYFDSYNNGYNQDEGGNSCSHYIKLSKEKVLEIINYLKVSKENSEVIGEKFGVSGRTIRAINSGEESPQNGISYPIREKLFLLDKTYEVTAVRDAYVKANTYELIDPINIKAQIDEYQRLISDFQSEVDSALSVSNAITEIEFSYEA